MNKITKILKLELHYLSMTGWKTLLSMLLLFTLLLASLSVAIGKYSSMVRDMDLLKRVNGNSVYFMGVMVGQEAQEKIRDILHGSPSVTAVIEPEPRYIVSVGTQSYTAVFVTEEYYSNLGIVCRGKGFDFSSDAGECIVPRGYIPGISLNGVLNLVFDEVPVETTDPEEEQTAETLYVPLKVCGVTSPEPQTLSLQGGGTYVTAAMLTEGRDVIFIKKTEKVREAFARVFSQSAAQKKTGGYTVLAVVGDGVPEPELTALQEQLQQYGQAVTVRQILENSGQELKEQTDRYLPVVVFVFLFSVIMMLCGEAIGYMSNAEEMEIWRRLGATEPTVKAVISIESAAVWVLSLLCSVLLLLLLRSGIIPWIDSSEIVLDRRSFPAMLLMCVLGGVFSVIQSGLLTRGQNRRATAHTDKPLSGE